MVVVHVNNLNEISFMFWKWILFCHVISIIRTIQLCINSIATYYQKLYSFLFQIHFWRASEEFRFFVGGRRNNFTGRRIYLIRQICRWRNLLPFPLVLFFISFFLSFGSPNIKIWRVVWVYITFIQYSTICKLYDVSWTKLKTYIHTYVCS